jgi:CheY-like chemotaxis protein
MPPHSPKCRSVHLCISLVLLYLGVLCLDYETAHLYHAVLSANGETQTVMKGITHGACDYLLKPVRLEQLRTIWQHVVRRRTCDARNHDNENDDAGKKAMRAEGENGGASRNKRTSRKGRDDNGDDGDDSDENSNENGDSSTQKKPRVVWSVELHRKFVAAVNQLGIDSKCLYLLNKTGNFSGRFSHNILFFLFGTPDNFFLTTSLLLVTHYSISLCL